MKKQKETGTGAAFYEWNKTYWNEGGNRPKNGGAIYFENTTEEFMPLMLGKFLTAKGIQSTHPLKIIALRNKVGRRFARIYDSFGMGYYELCTHIPFLTLIRSMWSSFCFLIRMLLGRDITRACCHGVRIGDLIYDHIIRVGNRLTIGRTINLREIKFVLRGYLYANVCKKMYRECPPVYFVAGDIIYLQGILVRFALKYGAQVINVTTGKETFAIEPNMVRSAYRIYSTDYYSRIVDRQIKAGLPHGWEEKVLAFLGQTYQGIGDWNTEKAYKGKVIEEGKTVLEKIGIRNQKKNIFIMPHCFSDAPHCAKEALYRDYYVWYEETLRIIAKIDNVNWIVKEHPSSGAYGEENVSKKLFEKYRSGHMYWFPNEYSTAVVGQIADAVVTVRGTAGMEMSCQGIRCILAGHAWYSNKGFTFEPRTIPEYERLLANLDHIKRLSDEETRLARRTMFGAFVFWDKVEDAYAVLSDDAYQNFRKHPSMQECIEKEYLRRLMELGGQEAMKDSYYYIWGQRYDK